MTSIDTLLRTTMSELEPLNSDMRIETLQDLIVGLLEYLGYEMAHHADTAKAKSAFILSVEVRQRLSG